MNKNYKGFPFQNLNLSYFSQLHREVVIHPIVILRHNTNKNIEPLDITVSVPTKLNWEKHFFSVFSPLSYMLFFLKWYQK